MRKKIELSVYIVMFIAIVSLLGISFAYFAAATTNDGNNNLSGQAFDFGASLNISTIHQASNLIPLANNLVATAITRENNECIDIYGREVCSLYRVVLSNTGDDIVLNPYITTTSSTYTTNNLKCQIYDSSYNAVSDVMTLSHTANAVTYITSSSSNLSISLSSTSQTYYLVIWITEVSSPQPSDYSKTYSGTLTFSSGIGGQASVDFNA